MDQRTQLHLAIEMLKEVIDRDVEIPLKTFGLSMTPSIRGGEWIAVRRVSPERIAVGDVVIYENDDLFVAHRVIRKRCKDGRIYITTKGDAHLGAEAEIPAEKVLAKAIALKKPGRIIEMDSFRWRLTNSLIAYYSLFIDNLYRSVPFLHGALRRQADRPLGRLGMRIVGGIIHLPIRLLMGSWELK